VDADRARVTIERRLQRRQPIAATVWLTRDAKRLPVRLEVSAGFGALRVELVDYRP
jgi:hypothetical protein